MRSRRQGTMMKKRETTVESIITRGVFRGVVVWDDEVARRRVVLLLLLLFGTAHPKRAPAWCADDLDAFACMTNDDDDDDTDAWRSFYSSSSSSAEETR